MTNEASELRADQVRVDQPQDRGNRLPLAYCLGGLDLSNLYIVSNVVFCLLVPLHDHVGNLTRQPKLLHTSQELLSGHCIKRSGKIHCYLESTYQKVRFMALMPADNRMAMTFARFADQGAMLEHPPKGIRRAPAWQVAILWE